MEIDLISLSGKLIERLPEILDSFGLEYADKGNSITLACPVHGGDNENGFSILRSGIGVWQCFTHQCHTQFKFPTLLTLIQALLKSDRLQDAIDWSAQFLNVDTTELEQEAKTISVNADFLYLHRYINKDIEKPSMFLIKETFLQGLTIPSCYFAGRGYSREILERFCVGDCSNPAELQKFNRAIVPCLDHKGRYVVGYHGRSIFEKCIKCGKHHAPHETCPITAEAKRWCEKWRISKGFNADSYLYNEWNLSKDLDYIILVEGAGDVWKLEQAGIRNSLALFGTKFTEQQRLILEAYPITKLIIATDNDDAGKKARHNIRSRCRKSFTIVDIVTNTNDIGETPIQELKELFYGAI